jgi:Beta-propeller repeat
VWERRYNGPPGRDDNAFAVGVDSEGNVFVTGYSADGGPYWGSAVYTAKYAGADGALIWEHRYGSRTNRNDSGMALAVASDGDLAVMGQSYDRIAGHPDYLTLKYAGATGIVMWEKRYDGPANGDDLAEAVAVDRSGNVVVTGAVGPRGSFDYYTAKYAATDGTVLWEKRYNGPANGDDYAQALAIDENSNVVVTGTSRSSEGANDYYTAKPQRTARSSGNAVTTVPRTRTTSCPHRVAWLWGATAWLP